MANNKSFTELTRVQIPAMIHLTRIGFRYFGKIKESDANIVYDPETNILLDVFKRQFAVLNPERKDEAIETLDKIRQELDNDDLGRSFYKRLISVSPIKLIDFEHPENNDFCFTAEFTCKNGEENFRPDITLFINGLPLAFAEVKKPNNQNGMIAESERMNQRRFPNRKLRRFINITQLMLFSNNMEYDTSGGITPIQGAFYCTAAREKARFSTFREENPNNDEIAPFHAFYPYGEVDEQTEKRILSDFNCQMIHTSPEYQTNKDFNTPTNRILTSMCSPKRFLFLLRYGFAYVQKKREVNKKIEDSEEKHIMRYQQFFASLAVLKKLDEGVSSGVIWHTQGSGKTALAYYLNQILSDYYAKQNKVAKFYFIVDRLDLLEQASQEFAARGLETKTANSRNELMEQFRVNQSLQGDNGKSEIIVVNIQRFAEDKTRVNLPSYGVNLQRVFIVDEAHRGYNPKGSFLANLFEADSNSIKIALTGTPLLKEDRASWKVFGKYIHTYYYDKSILDGYTLKIIREDIETSYRESLSEIYDSIEHLVQKKDIKKEDIIEHNRYVKELLRYIIKDFHDFRVRFDDDSLGGMIVCETSGQAKKLYKFFNSIQQELNLTEKPLRAELILYDVDDKETRKKHIADFKENKTVDILIVFNMLLTGFDAKRLKKLYLGRKLDGHGLLQALTRVNRPYKEMHYGYIVDFADIKKNFDETNAAYIRELANFNNPEETGDINGIEPFQNIIEDPQKLIEEMRATQQVLFEFNLENAEVFSKQISNIDEKNQLLSVKKALVSVRETLNIVRTFGDEALKSQMKRFEIRKLSELISETTRAIAIFNQKEAFKNVDETSRIINQAMSEIEFHFQRMSEEELRIIQGKREEFQRKWGRIIQSFRENVDPDDPEYITLKEAFFQYFEKRGFVIESVNEFDENSRMIDEFARKLNLIKRWNDNLLHRYNDDVKFVRVHKRIKEENNKRKSRNEEPIITPYDDELVYFLINVKDSIDQKVYDRNDILKKDEYFEGTVREQIARGTKKLGVTIPRKDRVFINNKISKQYLSQYDAIYKTA